MPVAVLVAFLGISTIGLAAQTHSNKILKGVTIANIDLGGLTKSEARTKLDKINNLKPINLLYGDKKWETSYENMGLTLYLDEMVDDAYNYNKTNGFFKNIIHTLKGDFGSKVDLPLKFNIKSNIIKNRLEGIKKEIDSPRVNASVTYKDDKVVLLPSKDGIDLDVSKSYSNILNNISKNNFDIKLIVNSTKPKITESDLKSIDTLLASYKTIYGGMANRDYNIVKSAEESSGILLKPGEEFSFNKLTGEKTIANGYKNAPVIESGKLVLGTGGGVCQTSSTIFNAALLSGMDIVNRRSHTIPSDYVALGRDATVFDGNPGQDFVFKNPFKNPVYVKNYTVNNKLVSEIFGSKSDLKNIKIVTRTIAVKSSGTKTVNDPSLPAGKRVIESYSRPTIQVVTYRQYLDSKGNVEDTEKIGYSTYPGKEGVVRVGAGAGSIAGVTTANSASSLGQNTGLGRTNLGQRNITHKQRLQTNNSNLNNR